MSSPVSAVTLIGTLLRDSSWRVAVTTTSCSPTTVCSLVPPLVGAAACWSASTGASATDSNAPKNSDAETHTACVEFFICRSSPVIP